MSTDRSSSLEVIAPSFMSGMASAIVSISAIGIILMPFLYLGEYVEQYRQAIRLYSGTLLQSYERIAGQLNSSELVANLVIFCTWAVVGFAVYYLVLFILSLFIDVMRFAHLLGFKNTDKKTLIVQSFEQLLIRTLGLICLASFLWFALEVIAPVVPTLVAAALSSSPIMGALYLFAAAVFIGMTVHIIVVLLRVIFLRVRLVSNI